LIEASVPLFPCWILRGRVDESHVEEGWEDEGEESNSGAAHQVQEHGEVGHGGAHKQQHQHHQGAERHPLPGVTYRGDENFIFFAKK
jgi:hypothetical protein